MTLNQLYKLLGQLIKQGHGRQSVCIDKPTFTHALESDGVLYQDVSGVRVEAYPVYGDDGGVTINKDGSERIRTGVLLYGISGSSMGKTEKQVRRLLIFAGSYAQASRYAAEKGILPSQYIHVCDRERLAGLDARQFDITFTGTWRQSEEVVKAHQYWATRLASQLK